jgi:voltage-gated potassium channel
VLVLLIPDPATRNIIYSIDVVLSVVFMIDFLVRFRRAPSRSNYFFRQFGWADLLGSLPLPQVKILRIFRVFRVARILRRSRPRDIARSLVQDRASSSLLTLLLVGILVLEFGSLTMLQLERNAPNANITTAPDALWYLVVTMSTVGYGDRYPVSTAGRALGTFVIVVGVGIFGTSPDILPTSSSRRGRSSSRLILRRPWLRRDAGSNRSRSC